MRHTALALLLALGCASTPPECRNTHDSAMCALTAQEWPAPAPPCPGCDASPWPDCTGPACNATYTGAPLAESCSTDLECEMLEDAILRARADKVRAI